MITDLSHLGALNTRLSHERARLASAKTAREVAIRTAWVKGIEREIEAEYKFLGIEPISAEISNLSDDDLLAALS